MKASNLILLHWNLLEKMFEAEKTKQVRGPQFYQAYLQGSVLDIGCGVDLVVEHAVPFDKEQGDANNILEYLAKESFDTVHSSHTLEHLYDPKKSLAEWWELVKPGGFMIIVVPDENLYEQGVWPSRFNNDHKFTFRASGSSSWSPVSINISDLAGSLVMADVISCEIQDHGYNHEMLNMAPATNWDKFTQFSMMNFIDNLREKDLLSTALLEEVNNLFFSMGAAVDQTLCSALAQIQVVVQKKIK